MENEPNNISIDEIGSIARLIDTELTIFERMKIKKRTLIRLFGSFIIYLATMFLFMLFL